jgi:predicted transcriptional regulator
MQMTKSESERLRQEIAERRSRQGRLRRDVEERAHAYARARRAAGATVRAIASELGIAVRTAKRWVAADRGEGVLVPVRVVAARSTRADLVVVTPSGLRVEGLDIDAVCTLVARCG